MVKRNEVRSGIERPRHQILERGLGPFLLRAVLQGEETKSYFKEGLHVETEQSFVNSNGKILRPDRIIKDGEDWTIIDYKSSEEGIEKHKNQVEEYCEVLSEIEGPNVRGIIIYTDPLKVLKVV